MLLCENKKRHLFDLSTGVRVAKQKDDNYTCNVVHDQVNNRFLNLVKEIIEEKIEKKEGEEEKEAEKRVEYFWTDFKIDSLSIKKNNITQGASPIDKIKEEYMQGKQTTAVPNVIKSLMKGKSSSLMNDTQTIKNFSGSHASALLLDFVKVNSEKLTFEF